MKQLLDNYYNNKKIKTILGKGTSFNGTMSFSDSLKINGAFIGEINANGLLIVGHEALVKASVKAGSVVVFGVIEGDVAADEKIEMLPKSRVYGDVKAKKIKISDDVVFSGKCEMIK